MTSPLNAPVLFRVAPNGRLGMVAATPGRWITVTGIQQEGLSVQFEAAPCVTVNHNFGRVPTVVVRNLGGTVVDADVQHTSANQFRVYFDVPTKGIVEAS